MRIFPFSDLIVSFLGDALVLFSETEIFHGLFVHESFVHAALQIFFRVVSACEVVVFVGSQAAHVCVMNFFAFVEMVKGKGALVGRSSGGDVGTGDHRIHHVNCACK